MHCGCVQSCEWTANCPVEGCANKCQAHGSVGELLLEMSDRALAFDGWELCTMLAYLVEDMRRKAVARLNTTDSILAVSDSSDRVLVRFSLYFFANSVGIRQAAVPC